MDVILNSKKQILHLIKCTVTISFEFGKKKSLTAQLIWWRDVVKVRRMIMR